MLQIILRFVHVVSGALWVGIFTFVTIFLMPVFAEVGQDGAKVQGALGRRRIQVVMPVLALLTILSGMWLFQRMSGGAAGAFIKTPMGLSFGIGGLAALLAFVVGMAFGRPAMMRSMKLGESLPSAPPADRPAITAEMQRLRGRVAALNRVVIVLLFIALSAMAVARYV